MNTCVCRKSKFKMSTNTMKTNNPSTPPPTTRREFLRTSAALAGTAALGTLALERSIHAAGNDVIRIGLIGCGGRGTEAASKPINNGHYMCLSSAMGRRGANRLLQPTPRE